MSRGTPARDISSEMAIRREEWAEALAEFAPVGQPSLIAFDKADDQQPPHAMELRNPAAIPATPDDDSTTRPRSEPKTTEEREPDDADGEVEPANQQELDSATGNVIGKHGTRTFAGLTNWLADPATDGIENPDILADLTSAIKRKGLTMPKASNRIDDAVHPSNWSYQPILARDMEIALKDRTASDSAVTARPTDDAGDGDDGDLDPYDYEVEFQLE